MLLQHFQIILPKIQGVRTKKVTIWMEHQMKVFFCGSGISIPPPTVLIDPDNTKKILGLVQLLTPMKLLLLG